MFRLMLSLMVTFNFVAISFADPIKKPTTADSDKLAKKCGEAFINAMLEGNAEEAIKLCATPYLDFSGKISDSLDSIKSELKKKPPAGIEIKVTETIALDQFNEWSKKHEGNELSADRLKSFGELIGKEGRIVILEVKVMNQVKNREETPNILVRIKDGKAHVVGGFRAAGQ